MNDSAKQLLDQLINKVERAQNEQANLKGSLLTTSGIKGRYSDASDNGFFGQLQKSLVKKSLSELAQKTICNPHLNPEESREDSADQAEGVKPKKEKEKAKRKKRPKPKDREEREISGREDIKNLLYSHFPKYLSSSFRFRIGELAYLKWHNEMCLVVVNYASQKLLVSSDMDFEDPSENNELDRNSQLPQVERRNVWLFDINEEIYLGTDNHNLYSKVNQIRPITLAGTEFRYSFPNLNYLNLRDKTALKYYFVPLYYVSFPGYKKRCSKLFRFWVQEKDLIKFKAVKFVPTVPLDVNPADIPEVNIEDLDIPDVGILDSVAMPSGSDERGGAGGRFGGDGAAEGIFVPREVGTDQETEPENELEGEGLGEKGSDRLPRPEVNFVINKLKGDKQWNKRKIVPVNEYVYDVIHNVYNRDLISGRYRSTADFFSNNVPWIIPARLKKLMVKEHKRVIANSVNLKLKLRFRRSIHCVVQNFKYLLLIVGKYYSITNMFYTEAEPAEDKRAREGERAEGGGAVDLARLNVPQMRICSLACLKFLESCLNLQGPVRFNEVYLNNFYWLDLLVAWIDANFLSSCCFTRVECLQLRAIKRIYKRPVSQILGFEYLCRVLSFDVFYANFLARIYRNGRPYQAYSQIIQLLLYYMSFVADEYTNGKIYGIRDDKQT